MMKFKKFLATAMTGAMMLGLVATAVPAVNAYADTNAKLATSENTIFYNTNNNQRTATGASITIDYDKMIATITSNSPASYITLGVYTIKEGTVQKETKSYTYPNSAEGVKVDLGFGSKKEFYLYAYLDGEKPNPSDLSVSALTTVVAQPEKLSVKVDTSQDNLVAALNSGNKAKEGKTPITFITGSAVTLADSAGETRFLSQYEYRSSFGGKWEDLTKLEEQYNTIRVAGAKIIIRKKAVLEGNPEGRAAAPAGPESKVTISAAPNKKKAKITYKDGTVNLTGKMEIALVNGSTPVAYVPIAETEDDEKTIKKQTIEEIAGLVGGNIDTGFKIIFREKANKKGPSLPDFIDIPKTLPLTVTSDTASGSAVSVTIPGRDSNIEASLTIEAGTGRNAGKYVLKATGAEFQFVEKFTDRVPTWKDVKVSETGITPSTIDTTDGKITVRLKGADDRIKGSWLPSKEEKLTAPASASPEE